MKLVAILNLTPDSFSDGGKYNSHDATISHLHKLLDDGADVIDVGAESTRPGAVPLDSDLEWQRLEKILPEIISEVKKFNRNHNKKVSTSIDSRHYETIVKSCELGIDIVNDVSGLADVKVIKFVAQNKIKCVFMHSLSVPANPNLIINPHLNVNAEIIDWAAKKMFDLQAMGVEKSQLIFDPGIGFNKNAAQSIKILKGINDFKVLQLPIYVGHSRKSFLNSIDFSQNEWHCQATDLNLNQDQKTAIISRYLYSKNVDYIRVHDVAINRNTSAKN